MKRLMLLDGLNLVRRIYEAIPADDSPEKVQGLLKSAVSSTRRALSELGPSHALCAFDHGGATWRHELYPGYKKSRKPMPVHLKEGMPELTRLIESLGVKCISQPGVEADDVIGFVTGKWCGVTEAPVDVVSTDKDMLKLLSQQVSIRDHFKAAWLDEAYCLNKFGVPPSQIEDLLALMGDKEDDIPGVEKVGKLTAARWLKQYGSLEGVLARADQVQGKVGVYLRRDAAMARLSKRLVEFKKDLELGLTWKMLELPRQ